MKFFIFFFLILVFLIKTGNVLSYEGIFNVNNIEIDKKHEKNNKDYLNSAFIKGFDNLIKRILLEKDYEKTKDTPLKLIKSLISHYQVIHVEEDSLQSKKQLNLFFDKEKINDFFYNKDISYSNKYCAAKFLSSGNLYHAGSSPCMFLFNRLKVSVIVCT